MLISVLWNLAVVEAASRDPSMTLRLSVGCWCAFKRSSVCSKGDDLIVIIMYSVVVVCVLYPKNKDYLSISQVEAMLKLVAYDWYDHSIQMRSFAQLIHTQVNIAGDAYKRAGWPVQWDAYSGGV